MRITLLLSLLSATLSAQIALPIGEYIGYVQFPDDVQVLRIEQKPDSTLIRLPNLAPDEKFFGATTVEGIGFQHRWRHGLINSFTHFLPITGSEVFLRKQLPAMVICGGDIFRPSPIKKRIVLSIPT